MKPQLLKNLQTHIDTENNDKAWLLLSLIAAHVPLQDPNFVMDYFISSIRTPEGVR